MKANDNRSSVIAHDGAAHLVKTGKSEKSAGDSLHTNLNRSTRPGGKRDYVTRARAEGIRSRLNAHQRAVLADVGRLGVVTGKQLQRLHYGDSPASGRLSRKQVGQLYQWRVLARLGWLGRVNQPGSTGYVYGAGIVGQRLLDPNRSRYFPRWTPRPSFLRHAVAVSELYVGLRESEKRGAIDLMTYDTEPLCWRRYFGPGGSKSMLKPDALAVVGIDDYEYRYFVEMDCATEHRPQIIAKAKTYIRYWQSGREQAETGIFPFVLWVAPDAARAAFLIDALSTLPAEHWRLFLVTTAEEAASKIAAGSIESISNRKEVT
jgi:hypothetical protein